jgi:hypothetical protein
MKKLLFIAFLLIFFITGFYWGRRTAPKKYGPVVFIDGNRAKPGAVWMVCPDYPNSLQGKKLDSRNAKIATYDQETNLTVIQFEACK